MPERQRPAVAQDEIVTLRNVVEAGGSYRAPLLYVLVAPRTIKTLEEWSTETK
jgi:hypothetical protein